MTDNFRTDIWNKSRSGTDDVSVKPFALGELLIPSRKMKGLILTLTCLASLRVPVALAQTMLPDAASSQMRGTRQNRSHGCLKPVRLFAIEDYNGPFKSVAASLVRRVENQTAQNLQNSEMHICPLTVRQKLTLAGQNSIEPITFIAAGFSAGISQAADYDSHFGQGASGYGQRFGAALADNTAGEFFGTFLFPVIFRQDPRYYRVQEGGTKYRMGHALAHIFVTQSDDGTRMFNYSEWFTVASATALSNVYHPGNRRGFGPSAGQVAITVGTDAGFNVLREFWPEMSRKLKLPFRPPQAVPPRRTGQGKSAYDAHSIEIDVQ